MPNDDDRSPFSRRGTDGGPTSPKPRFAPWLIVPVLLVGLLVFNNVLSNTQRDSITYNEFIEAVEQDRLDPETTVKISDSAITGAIQTSDGVQEFSTTLAPNFQTQDLATFLQENDVNFEFEQPTEAELERRRNLT